MRIGECLPVFCLHHGDDLREDRVDVGLLVGSELVQSRRKSIVQRPGSGLCGRFPSIGEEQPDTATIGLSAGAGQQASRFQPVDDAGDGGPTQFSMSGQRAGRVRSAGRQGQQAHELRSGQLMPPGQLTAEQIHRPGDPPKGPKNTVVEGSAHGAAVLAAVEKTRESGRAVVAPGTTRPDIWRTGPAWRVWLLWLALGTLFPGGLHDASAKPVRFRATDKPVKVLLISSSLGRFRFGSFAQYLERVCPATEFASRTQHAVNTRWMIETFRSDVLRPRSVDARQGEHWLLYQGGLNSVSTPERTVADMVRLFRMAHGAGFKVLAIGVTPWGEDSDSRFDGFDGLRRHDKTRHLADFVAGRLGPVQALGSRRANRRDRPQWVAAELPDIGVDVLDTALRNKTAILRRSKSLIRQWKRTRWVRRRYPDMQEAVRRARAVPQWFPNPEQSWDHVHLDYRGHRTIAKTVCGRLPTTWRCDCASLDTYRWQRGRGLVTK
ncbi:MAG: hypothetical protein ACI9WU_001653 [Myxococcota bacterium]|jgi:hypothetical protein